MYAWGSTVHGELGVGGIEEDYIYTPRLLDWDTEVQFFKEVACSANHTIFLTKDGKVYSCGNNDFGQLGHSQSRKRPHPITALNAYQITHVACGLYHSVALNEWGKVFTWGSNKAGQLGNPECKTSQSDPKIIRKLNTSHVVQIASGESHCLALTSGGDIYAWGSNENGQLGIGETTLTFQSEPTKLTTLSGLPFALIACGSNHSFALSLSGSVFGWGKNSHGQLGLNNTEDKLYPQHIKFLRSVKVRYIVCGEEFSNFLTQEGGVFSCGAGAYGQLGHGNRTDELLPKMVMELMGSTITQVVCGQRHTLAFIPSGGNVYSFGLGSAGQLGLGKNVNRTLIPQNMNGPWTASNNTSKDRGNHIIHRVFAGGNHCFALVTKRTEKIAPYDCRVYSSQTQILKLSLEFLHSNLQNPPKDKNSELMPYLETVFKSLACINASFLLDNHEHYNCTIKNHGINLAKAEETFNFIARSQNKEVKKLIFDTMTNTENNLFKQFSASPPDVESLRAYLILPLYHEFDNARRYENIQLLYARAVLQLTGNAKNALDKWLLMMPPHQYERFVNCYKGVVIFIIKHLNIDKANEIIPANADLKTILDFLARLHLLNKTNNKTIIPSENFFIPELNDYVDVKLDYLLWLSDEPRHGVLFLCNYSYLFDTMAKVMLLQLDTYLQRMSATNEAARRAALIMFLNLRSNGPVTQFLELYIDRSKIVQNTIRQLQGLSSLDLKKDLKVKFLNEDGEDAGGVKREFFLLVLREILDPKYGMFMTYDESTRLYWFMPQPLESTEMYGLIGMICGLAIYNSITIYLPFPLAMYKKIQKEKIVLDDLCELNPYVGRSMKTMLECEVQVFNEEFPDIYFEISYMNLGQLVLVELKPNGKNIRVTVENRKEYVDLYVDYIFNKSCVSQFNAFCNEFLRVCSNRVMSLFHAFELMALVTGNENYDWFKLQEVAKYKNGYSSSDQQIVWFWEVFHDLNLKQKKDFLLFLTGTDRVPVQGMGEIKIEIQPTADDRFLPVAHTCTLQLDLPRYRTKERLKYKLLQAIQHNQGFTIA